MRSLRSLLMSALLACAVPAPVLLCAAPAAAQDARNKALAEELFQQGRTLMDEGKTEEACARFEQSQKLEAKLGTLLNMAACHEKLGRTASAWGEFTEAATLAQKRGEADRERFARDHASALEAKLSKVVLKNTNPPDGLQVTLDGKPLPVGVMGAPLPLDPGAHVLIVSAAGKKPREIPFNVPAGPTQFDVMIPLLEDAPAPPPPPPSPPSPPPPGPGAPVPQPGGGSSGPPVLAIVGFSVGGAGLLIGAITGGVSLSMASDLTDGVTCPNNVCSGDAADDLSTATALANVSNVSLAIGAVGAAVGVIGLVVHDGGDSPDAATVSVVPVGDVGAGVRLRF